MVAAPVDERACGSLYRDWLFGHVVCLDDNVWDNSCKKGFRENSVRKKREWPVPHM